MKLYIILGLLVVMVLLGPSMSLGQGEQIGTVREPITTGSRAMEYNIDRPGMDYRSFYLPRAQPALCQSACTKESRCRTWTYVRPNTSQGPRPVCWLKHDVPNPIGNPCCVSGKVKR